jgi:hypothetical protein
MAERFGFETGKLVMSQFRSRTRIGRKKRLLEEAEKILRSGAVEQPKWFNALRAVPPTSVQSAMRPRQIVYPEDKLIRAYYNRDPSAKFVPADLASTEMHHVRAFARRQLKVMKRKGIPENEALLVVEAEAALENTRAAAAEKAGLAFARSLTSAHQLPTNYLEQIQEEEELAWRATKSAKALDTATRKKRAQDAANESTRLSEREKKGKAVVTDTDADKGKREARSAEATV